MIISWADGAPVLASLSGFLSSYRTEDAAHTFQCAHPPRPGSPPGPFLRYTAYMDTELTCDKCKYWEWRLKDVRLSRDKAAQENVKRSLNGCPIVPIVGFYDDVSRIKKAFEQHKLFEQVA